MHTSNLLRHRRRGIVAMALAAPLQLALAQAAANQRIVITGNPLGNVTVAAPVSVLAGDELVLQRGSSLADTVGALPGVSATYFGPNANRPTIRGLDGDRVRILSNAGASFDASSLSFDHAVPIDPLIVERVEVLRGPAALLYGGGAIGGVVNAIDNRIPRQPIGAPSGVAELRLGGAAAERSGAALLETGDGRYALHADAFGRQTSDLNVPRYTPIADGTALPATGRVRNSASRTGGGAIGASWFAGGSRVGVAADSYDSRYGPVAEPDIAIRMRRDHAGLSGEWKGTAGPLVALRAQIDATRYRHDEVEGNGAIGTTFSNTGREARFEAQHVFGALRGVAGLQFETSDFSALGDEAFVPTTRSRRGALFVLEELPSPLGTLSAGLRLERARVASAGDGGHAVGRFGAPSERRCALRSASLSDVLPLAANWTLSASWSHTERAPTASELYANGVHAATGAFERGDPTLGAERGRNIDLALQWQRDGDHLRVGAFRTRFSRYLSLEATGAVVDEGLPEYAVRAVRARLDGIEIEGRRRLLERPWTLDLSGKLDVARAGNRDNGEPLPRIAPLRALLRLDLGAEPWGGRLEIDHAARQHRVPATDVPTAGYTIVNLTLTRRFDLAAKADALAFAIIGNLGDRLAFSASSLRTVRELAPLPGRSLKAGLRIAF